MKIKSFVYVKILVIIILFCLLSLFFARTILSKQIDDVNPLIPCEDSILEKSESLAVIPLYKNFSLSENASWCNQILSMNKTLIMHGVYHTYNEFLGNMSKEDIEKGKEEFKKCFGFYPKIFEAPQLALSAENAKLLREEGFEIRHTRYNLFHRVYHCSDTGKFSNDFINRF